MPVAAASLLAGAGFLAWAVRGRSASVLAPSVWKGPTNRKAIALTFDDGPSESTPQFLELLAEHNARATFFQIGKNVERLPSVARMVLDFGCEIGNHSYTHPRFDFTSGGTQLRELELAQKAIRDHCGVTPGWFRAPYGVRWFGMGEAQRRSGLTGVMWTAIGRDWKLDASAITLRMKNAASSGAIFCLHDGRAIESKPEVGATLAALRQILPELRAEGYALVTVSELLCLR